ncbi:MAG: hypothetical protein OEZ36_14290, partial [Spirochaetota bacterium]|nr:hypothetical protein [Spirochaetota bacterium]
MKSLINKVKPLAHSLKILALAAFALGVSLKPSLSHACSVCAPLEGESSIWMVWILSPLPLVMGGLIIWYVIRQSKKMSRE